jgi:hypothetical protein
MVAMGLEEVLNGSLDGERKLRAVLDEARLSQQLAVVRGDRKLNAFHSD